MLMDEISVSEFKATCLKLIEKIRSTGVSVLITKNGHPAALIGPAPRVSTDRIQAGALKNKIKIKGDLLSPLETHDWEVLK